MTVTLYLCVYSYSYVHIRMFSTRSDVSTTPFLHLRYDGTDCALMVTAPETVFSRDECQHGNFKATFTLRCVSYCLRASSLLYMCVHVYMLFVIPVAV